MREDETRASSSRSDHPTSGPGLVVAIDGPSGSGKSTVARRVAQRLGLRYLDTGAMYRALTWRVLAAGVDPEDANAVLEVTERSEMTVTPDPLAPSIVVDGSPADGHIRTREVSGAVSAVSRVPGVRQRMVDLQRRIAGTGGIVVEGRDIGSVVLPDAPVKIYLTASSEARALRRTRELSETADGAGGLDVGTVRADLERRDELDSSRVTSPLVQAPDAVALDTTRMTVDEVVAAVLGLCAAVGSDGADQDARVTPGAGAG